MGDQNPICTLGDYSKPSHEGYRNTIELPVGNNMVPLRSDTIRLVQNGCSFHGLWSEDLNQHLKDFLKLVDSLYLDSENRERTCLCPSPQPQALGTTFKARARDYMATHFERMERFKNVIFKQCEEINNKMTKIGEEERSDKMDETLDNTVKPTVTEMEIQVKESERSNETKNKPIKKAERKEVEEVLSSRLVEYYMKHKINERLIEGVVDNNRFNDSLSMARVRKVKGKTYNVLPRGHVYEAILKKKITKEEEVEGNFKIPCSIGGLKHIPAETDIRLSLASHSYIYPLGITEDVLVKVAEHVYPIDFVILDIKENEKRPFILGTPFLTTTKATIKFDKGTITPRSGKSKISFHRIHDSSCMTEKGVKNDIKPIAPTMTVNRLVLEWEEKINLHLEREMEFNQ
ncbi:zinc finger, CCHC-type containing protein [Tanacetum coccineum]